MMIVNNDRGATSHFYNAYLRIYFVHKKCSMIEEEHFSGHVLHFLDLRVNLLPVVTITDKSLQVIFHKNGVRVIDVEQIKLTARKKKKKKKNFVTVNEIFSKKTRILCKRNWHKKENNWSSTPVFKTNKEKGVYVK